MSATPQQAAALAAIEAAVGVLRGSFEDEPPAPTYALTAEPPVVDEGATVTFRLVTTGIPPGVRVPYRLFGDMDAADVSASLTDDFVVGQDGRASLVVPLVVDRKTEGDERLTCAVDEDRQAATVVIRDTSITPPGPEYSLIADPAVVDEGATVTFRLSTTGVPAGTIVGYRLFGVSAADIGAPLDGVLTIDETGRAALAVPVVADATTEGPEGITCLVGDDLARATVSIRDTSVAPPPPPPTGRVEVRGPNVLRKPRGGLNNFDNGISDYLDVSDLPAPIPWEVYVDDQQTLAPSRGGVEALGSWQRFHLFGHTQGLYQPMPRMVDGHLRQLYPNAGNFPDHAVHLLRSGSERLVHGPRGVSVPSPYTTWHGHTRREGSVVHTSPAIPLYIGLTLHGHVVHAMRDGSMAPGGIVPVESWANDFSYYEPDRKVFFYVDTGKGRVMMVDRRESPWAVTTLVDGFRQADSCRAIGHKVYVADSIAGEVWEVDVPSRAKRLVCRIPHAFWVDYFSDGSLAVAARTLAVYRVDPASGSVGPNLTPSVYVNPPQAWVTVDVDRWGHMGAVDTFVVLGVTASVRGFHRIDRNGKTMEPEFGNHQNACGPLKWVGEPWGHYPWTGAHHPDEALLMVQGMANLVPQIIAVVPPRAGWVGMRTPDSHAGWYDKGRRVALYGDDVANAVSDRYTTLLPQLAAGGGGLVTSDHMAYWTHDRLRAFLLDGGLGVQPRALGRDSVQGWGMQRLMNSQRYLIDGWPLVQRWIDYCKGLPA